MRFSNRFVFALSKFLKIAVQPTFWAPAAVMLMVGGTVTWIYWKNPGGVDGEDAQAPDPENPLANLLRLTEGNESASDTNELLLLQELNRAGVSPVTSGKIETPQESRQAKNDSTPTDYFRIGVAQGSRQNQSVSGLSRSSGLFGANQYSAPGSTFLGGGTNPGLNTFTSIPNTNTASVNPLQAAMDRYATDDTTIPAAEARRLDNTAIDRRSAGIRTTDPSASNGTLPGQTDSTGNIPGQNPIGSNAFGQSVPGLQGQSLNNPAFPQSGYLPNAPAVSVPTAGANPATLSRPGVSANSGTYLSPSAYGVPPAIPSLPAANAPVPATNLGRSALPPNQFGQGQNAGLNQNFVNPGGQNFANPPGTTAVQAVPPPPFSAPRSVPGRYIGGGQINTFGNP